MTIAYTSTDEVQTAMYSILVPSGTLDTVLSGLGLLAVYDYASVPQNAPFDYLTLGDGYEIASDTFGLDGTADGWYYFATLHLWSAQRGTKNPEQMIGRLNQLFHRQSLSLATLHHCYTLQQRCINMIDAAGTIPILHSSLQYKIYSTQ